jgi:hypothetical protein
MVVLASGKMNEIGSNRRTTMGGTGVTSSVASVDMTVNANLPPRQIVYRWRSDDDKRDAEAAEAERLRDEGKLIEHEASPQPSNKD